MHGLDGTGESGSADCQLSSVVKMTTVSALPPYHARVNDRKMKKDEKETGQIGWIRRRTRCGNLHRGDERVQQGQGKN